MQFIISLRFLTVVMASKELQSYSTPIVWGSAVSFRSGETEEQICQRSEC